jgi:hypothetical protein
VVAAMSGFLTILPIEFGLVFVAQLASAALGFALLVGSTGALISVRTYVR